MLVSAIHQHEWATGTRMSLPFWTSLPPPTPPHFSWLSQSVGWIWASHIIWKFPLAIYFTYSNVFLGRKVMTNLDSIFKSRDVTLPTKVRLVKAIVFPVGMYGCESWTMKKAEHWRIDAFELWCWRRLLRVPWTARRSDQSIQKEISPGISLEGMMLKLKLQYFGHLLQRVDSM